ncbi:MAG: Ppx/GppA family phosphatase [Sphingomonadales bacterium]|jgi:exopolyphosphatase/guanosine-5'-triphosphate,3'-diphosphate pyrophosphatase|nr:Ppx/GppA family phosphatase [Sphingomonadales bacterium]MBK9268475.1 Ppx/GppA family phosphatase [Sphingomonadales bacterium]MBP6434723.1 Ppx/GppA family phosphatase [Sphingorhabdus sp.]
MGDHIAPSPHKGGRGKGARKKGPNRRKSADAATGGGASRDTDANGAPKFSHDNRFAGGGWLGRTAYAALDLGTNNCRLLIARASHDGFTVVDAFSRVVRLGEGLATTGKMSEEAMDRAIEALSVCADKLKRRNVILARSVATEACRQALNGTQFIERVKQETGIMLDVISPKEEARLAVMGCHALLEPGDGPALIFDIGGGSTELVLVSTDGVVPEILDWASVPWGVVSLTESEPLEGEDEAALADTYARMRKKVSDAFAAFAARLPAGGGDHRLLGTSGTVTTLASVYLKLQSYDRKQIDGLHLPTEAMREISQTLAALPPAGRARFPTIGQERSDLVVAGCAILEAIFDIWPGERLGVADRGIREGILRALMASDAKRRGRRPA